ncbi:hypothetical protein [Halomonas sp. BM-2019]|uniref:hypothetical protein n=1 Tax=Halomonas sp. BM-2019 TaxID=2811227 RepID=UPI001B3C46EF|nr:MAG: hypothetical protein J5F18_09720 [Halomonas sp. BM-2019]
MMVIFAVLLPPRWANAQIVDCGRPSTAATQFTVYIDEPYYASEAFASDADLVTFMNRLWFLLDQERDRLWEERSNIPVRFKLCDGRKPSIDGRDFDQRLVNLLYNQGVIVEIWGVLDAHIRDGQVHDRQARIGYLLVPVRFAFLSSQDAPPSMYFVRYPEDPTTPAQDFLELFAQATDIDGYVAMGLGIKFLRLGDFELAQKNLCKGSLLLEQVRLQAQGGLRRQLHELTSFAKDAAAMAIHSAGEGSPLALLDPARPCPSEG